MKAQVLHTPRPIAEGPLVPEERKPRAPGPGEVRVAVSVCGVCHTDLHTVEGDLELPGLPIVPGHQVVGRVVARGEGVDGPALGERVGIPWLADTCGRCEACRAGRENLCPRARFTGLHLDGGYAESITVPAAAAYPLPAGLDDAHAAPLLCAGIIGYRALRLSGVEPGGRLGLLGFGASAHLAIQVARHRGQRVAVFSRGDAHRAHALELGAEWVGTLDERPPFALDGLVNFTPAGPTVPVALAKLRPGGVQVLAGVHMSPLPAFPYDLLYGERVLRSVANFTAADARELLALAAEIPLRSEIECFPLGEAHAALGRLAEGSLRGAAVLRVEAPGSLGSDQEP